MGTAGYMAPEQASGKPVDTRVDVWALGVVLYEMLAGSRPFTGDDVSKTLAHVIAVDPDWTALPRDVPPVLASFMRGCLEKDPKRRVHHVADLRLAMDGAFESAGPADDGVGAPTRSWGGGARPACAGRPDRGARRRFPGLTVATLGSGPTPRHPIRTSLARRPPGRRRGGY